MIIKILQKYLNMFQFILCIESNHEQKFTILTKVIKIS